MVREDPSHPVVPPSDTDPRPGYILSGFFFERGYLSGGLGAPGDEERAGGVSPLGVPGARVPVHLGGHSSFSSTTAVSVARIDNSTLVRRCLDGDDDAWRALIERYRSLVYSMALRTGLDSTDADEVFQQVWIELHRSLARLRDPDALPGWLSVATRRLSYRRAMERSRWVEGTFDEMVDPKEGPDTAVESLEQRRQVDEALQELGDPCASLLRLLFFQSPPLTYPEIAARAEVPRGSIGPMRGRCLSRLARLMGGER